MSGEQERLSDIAESVSRDGYYLAEELIVDHDLIENLKTNLITAHSTQVGRERSFYPGTVHFVPRVDAIFLDLLIQRDLVAVVNHVYGTDHIVHSYNGLVLDPASEMIQHKPHRDGHRETRGERPEAFQILLLLDDSVELNGATRVMPASHRRTSGAPTHAEFDQQAVTIEAPTGSVLFFDSALFHAAGVNRTDEPRHRLTICYVRPDMRQQLNFESLLSGQETRLTPQIKALLGIGHGVPESVEEFYERAERMFK
jgi:ectoine hydroxylase-related dioxygenase (phytanoyl-CoA dioxygenase family)